MNERVSPSVAARLVGDVIGNYPGGAKSASKTYIAALTQVLLSYPKSIVERVADPMRGVARESEFMPSPALLIAWCDRESAAVRKLSETQIQQAAAQRRVLEDRAEADRLEVERRRRPTITELKGKYGSTFGLDADDEATRRRRAVGERIDHANAVLFARECAVHGLSPDNPVTPSLLRAEWQRQAGRTFTDAEFAALLGRDKGRGSKTHGRAS